MLIILFYTFKKIFKENSKTISFLLTLIENGIKKKKTWQAFFHFFIKIRGLCSKPNTLFLFTVSRKTPVEVSHFHRGYLKFKNRVSRLSFPIAPSPSLGAVPVRTWPPSAYSRSNALSALPIHHLSEPNAICLNRASSSD